MARASGRHPAQRADARRWIRPIGLLALSAACTWIIVGLVGRVDWAAVGEAIGGVSWWQVPILLSVLILRQVLNASPFVFFIPGIGVRRATQSDQAAILTSMIAPPPADMLLRLAMFRSWGIPMTQGLAGSLMNVFTFYAIRFGVPLLGLCLVLASPVPYHAVYTWVALLGGAIGLAVLALLWAVLRRERTAVWLGGTGGRLVARVRRSVDPGAWVRSAVDFRANVIDRAARGVPLSLAALLVMVVVDGALLTLCLRFVGVGPGELPTMAVVAVFLMAYPLTLFPLAGLGVLDACVLAALVDTGGLALEADLVAGLVLYRVTTLLVPMLLGAGSVTWWRRSRESADSLADAP